ncbi:hypothetical protein IscW_ISCW001597 [Ixodes scapularis]|uniref:Uncharacterized protein n=1 Tax=Ixodes scapularis TaxID=6945 RepID=B7P577_IXOSC|nr:hypothetical protein IscW_ISCW001597 [Ixodes scapularis]|eukprot:XP_002407111.1 hypothetical protein IscW_ISCW001597 [Ixodes scapularis]
MELLGGGPCHQSRARWTLNKRGEFGQRDLPQVRRQSVAAPAPGDTAQREAPQGPSASTAAADASDTRDDESSGSLLIDEPELDALPASPESPAGGATTSSSSDPGVVRRIPLEAAGELTTTPGFRRPTETLGAPLHRSVRK